MADQSANNKFTMTDGTTDTWIPDRTGYYRLKVGGGGSPNFNSFTVDVQQGGDSLTGLGALSAYLDKLVHLIGGQAVSFIPSGAVTSVQVEIVSE